jgi:uncharacterized protein with PQ loop repeat
VILHDKGTRGTGGLDWISKEGVLLMSSTTMQETRANWDWKLWFQWVLANTVAETVGLGGTLLIGFLLLSNAEKTMGIVLAAVLGVLAATFIEGTVVGTMQWLVLRRPLKSMRWRVWALATALGAFVAWTLGMLPFLFTSADTGATSSAEMSDLVIYTLAAALGLVSGTILGFPQWLVLRRYVQKAGWWVLANALAWMLGMVIVFVGTSFIPAKGITWQLALPLLFVVAAGATVGAVHGFALIWLLRSRRSVATA